jgi:hypothetical protein
MWYRYRLANIDRDPGAGKSNKKINLISCPVYLLRYVLRLLPKLKVLYNYYAFYALSPIPVPIQLGQWI